MLPPGRYIFCGTFRRPGLNPASRTLSGTLLCGVRTFLPHHLTRQERPSGPAANRDIIADFGRQTSDSDFGRRTSDIRPPTSEPGDFTLLDLAQSGSVSVFGRRPRSDARVMTTLEAIRIALLSLWANKLRSALT